LKYPGLAREAILGTSVGSEWWGEGVRIESVKHMELCLKEIVRIFLIIITDSDAMRILLGLWWAAIVNGEE
jgi:hypothetical protein